MTEPNRCAEMRLEEFRSAWETLDPAYTDPAVCEAQLRDYRDLLEPLLTAVHLLYRRMNKVDNAAYVAAIVRCTGDTDAASELWYAEYGGDYHAQVYDHLHRIADGRPSHSCAIDKLATIGEHQARCCAMRCKWRSDPFPSVEEAERAGDEHHTEMQAVEVERDRLGR